jgi:hypothetical protein
VKNKNQQAGDAVSLVYQCALPLSTRTVQYVTDLLRKHLKAIRSRWRSLPAGRIVEHLKAAGRAPVEHGFAHLKTWRILTKLRTSPARATNLLRALLVLTNLELDR